MLVFLSAENKIFCCQDRLCDVCIVLRETLGLTKSFRIVRPCL